MASATKSLQANSIGCMISFTWWGISKSLSSEQRDQAAEPFGADGESLSASKRLIDRKSPAWAAVCLVKRHARCFWVGCTLPYPDPGVRLLKRSMVENFNEKMEEFKGDLAARVDDLEKQYPAIRDNARERLGTLYDEHNYPESLTGLFGITWGFPSLDPPNYLMELNPKVYEAELERVQARFSVAVDLAEQAFADEFGKLVQHLAERLTDGPDGRKVVKDSAVDNMNEFFEKFSKMSIRSNAQLDDLVDQAKRLLKGVDGAALRAKDADADRNVIKMGMETIASKLESEIITLPRRRVVLAAKKETTDV